MATAILTHWVAFFGTPDIIISDMDQMFTGAEVQQFRRDRNIPLQTVISGDRQSLGGT